MTTADIFVITRRIPVGPRPNPERSTLIKKLIEAMC